MITTLKTDITVDDICKGFVFIACQNLQCKFIHIFCKIQNFKTFVFYHFSPYRSHYLSGFAFTHRHQVSDVRYCEICL